MRYDLLEILRGNPYPGRGIVLGLNGCGRSSVLLYFIMGRSVNSRNRVFEKTGDGICTKAFDPAKLTDPSLVIYHPVREWSGRTIVTNGIQTDAILQGLQDGGCLRDALSQWEFEPDPPIYTPRISGLIEPGGSYSLSIIKTADGDPACCCRYFFEYSDPLPGTGRFISTYISDGDPPPSFIGEPLTISITAENGVEDFARSVWESLDAENKVSLYASMITLATGEKQEIIFNKNM